MKQNDQNKTNRTLLRITVTAMLMALSVVVGIVCKNFFTWGVYYRVTFENFPIILAGFCFGPVYGLVAGVGADALSCLMSTNPMINPVISLGAAAVGFLSGLVPMLLHKQRPHLRGRILLIPTVAAAHLIGQVLIKSIGKIFMLGMPPVGMLIGLGISCAVGTAEYFLLCLLLRNRPISDTLKGAANYDVF